MDTDEEQQWRVVEGIANDLDSALGAASTEANSRAESYPSIDPAVDVSDVRKASASLHALSSRRTAAVETLRDAETEELALLIERRVLLRRLRDVAALLADAESSIAREAEAGPSADSDASPGQAASSASTFSVAARTREKAAVADIRTALATPQGNFVCPQLMRPRPE
eukprot:TRINITY_DN13256_c0_g1_i1.p2 TRINITY_DN13256_c0_g1~~TRINITY_DN13256_c0_g1_i1.p2  ORF type:complete len:169 (+),score=18.35 TRINITY_DN13256_c0_g1_i1:163-669(+)